MTKMTAIAMLVAGSSSLAMAADEFRQHDAHVHGEVELNLAQDGNEILVEITAPGADVVGFEHAPKTDEQHHAVEDALAALKDANSLLAFNAEANCKLEHASSSTTLMAGEHDEHDHHDDHKGHDHDEHEHHDDHKDHGHDEHDHHDDHKGHDHDEHDHQDDHKGHDHDEHDHHDHEGSHGEFTAEYHFECGDASKLTQIDTQWFAKFPTTESIHANVLTDTVQTAAELNKNNTSIKF
ncbi:zinc uptake protein ZrgA [Vibrio maerlii]|uniref:zinc uptake protein ZrgA n=1 Tax=Vibrio maerlii TaxID=2231648 RepID=UPI000E3C3B5A|nr:DUF2796 domain-containing protein [Vibrio maerlii]